MATAVGGHSSGTAVVVSTILFCSLAGLLTIARLYTRMRVTNSVGVDDYLIVLGQASESTANKPWLDSADHDQILAVLLTVCMVKQGRTIPRAHVSQRRWFMLMALQYHMAWDDILQVSATGTWKGR